MRGLLLLIAFLAEVAAEKYACIFDCHLYGSGGHGSGTGYLEYQCDEGAAACCAWQKCVEPASKLYNGLICPLQTEEAPTSESGAKYVVGVSASDATRFPRNAYPCPSSVCSAPDEHVTTCSYPDNTHSSGCFGPGCSLKKLSEFSA